MKKLIISLIAISFSTNSLKAHKEFTHQYIVRKAYKLLTYQIGASIPILDDFISLAEYPTDACLIDEHSNIDECGNVIGGAWAEDSNDPIFHYDSNWPTSAWVSISHFWDADRTDTCDVNLGFLALTQFRTKVGDNSLFKIQSYYRAKDLGSEFHIDLSNGVRHYFTYNTLGEFYKTGNIIYNGYRSGNNRIGRINAISNFENIFNINQNNHALRNKIVFNILGRMCHLLGDMGVPAHVHDEQHSCTDLSQFLHFQNCDSYEQMMDVKVNDQYAENSSNYLDPTYWNGVNLLTKKGGYVKINCIESNPLRFLMYTTNQITDHFASREQDGDDDYEHIGEIDYILKKATGPTKKSFYKSIDNLLLPLAIMAYDKEGLVGVRDAVFPYVIRATASLLLKFACDAGLLDEFTNSNLSTGVADYKTEEQFYSSAFGNEVKLSGYYYEFQAKRSVIAGKISSNSNHTITIEDKTIADLHAGGYVDLKIGFHATAGKEASTHLYISPPNYCCTNTSTTLAPITNLNKQTEEEIPTNPELKITLNENRTLANGAKYKEETRSKEFTIEAYPNPISKKTKIEYTVPIKSILDIKITNTKGEEIKKIVTESKHDQGKYEVEWNVEKEANGLYYCVLSSGGKQYVKTLIISK